MTTRSGCVQSAWIAVGSSPDELEAIITSGRAAASIWACSLRLRSSRLGRVFLHEVRLRHGLFDGSDEA